MKHLFALTVAVLALLSTGCSGGDTHESLMAENIKSMKEFVATLETVKDEASAKAAKPKLEAHIKEMEDAKQRQAKLPTPTEAEGKVLLEKHGKELEEIQQKLMSNMLRIGLDEKLRTALEGLNMDSVK